MNLVPASPGRRTPGHHTPGHIVHGRPADGRPADGRPADGRIVHGRSALTAFVPLLCGAVLLSGCSEGVVRTFGLSRDAPDEFTVTTRAPLSMPPDYNLRPPRPGAARPQEQSARQQAEEALVPQLALGAPQGGETPGQAALLQEIGTPAPADIRAKVDQEAANGRASDGFIDKLLYWRKPNAEAAQVDPSKESQRLRQNAALGQGPDVGDTPIIQPKRNGWFSNLFSWL